MGKLVNREIKDVGQKVVKNMMEQVNSFAEIERTPLTNKEKSFAVNIIENINKNVVERKISWNDLDIIGCSLPSQVKHFARTGLSIAENEIYVDIRGNYKTGKKDIRLVKQYQGIEKEIVRWCSKKIVSFIKDIVCVGDDFVLETDFEKGIKKVVKHVKNYDIDRNDLKNMTSAYQIAYEEKEDGTLVQRLALIDKNRINIAYNASPSNEKKVWKDHTRKMVLKTATWELYNSVLKPFMNIPMEIKEDWKRTNSDMNWNVEDIKEVKEYEEDKEIENKEDIDNNSEDVNIEEQKEEEDKNIDENGVKNEEKDFKGEF